ncbi:MAG: SH3 domain-containing protein [Anaerolineales bacterium]
MSKYGRTSLILVGALLVATSCLLPTIKVTDPNAQATILAVTINAAVLDTQVVVGTAAGPILPATATHTPNPTWTPSFTPTPSLTPTLLILDTFTPTIPMISVSVPTNCRSGPSTIYTITGALLVGQFAQVYGQDPTGSWWQIRDPSGGEYCWVSDKYGTLTGYTGDVPVYTPPPTPLPTYTPTVAPGFDLSYDGLVSCSGEWWPQLRLNNYGDITFRSIDIEVHDNANSHTVANDWNSFINNYDCSSTTSRSTLEPDRAVTVSSPPFNSDPSGHRLRATVTLCSERNLDGDCATETITFKP